MSGANSMQASVTFNDVAICFSEDDWMCLEEWQKEMYRNVMHEIHSVLTSMGYTISNPDVLVRIHNPEVNSPGKSHGSTKEKSSCKLSSGFLSSNPDIILRVIKHDDVLLEDSEQPHEETGSSSGDEDNLQLDNGSTICKVEDLSDDPCPYQESVSVSKASKVQTSKKRIAKDLRSRKAKNNLQRDHSSEKTAPRTSVMERTNENVRVVGLTRKPAEKKANTKERLYICSFCGKGFGGNSLLVRHMRIHTGEKPYACNHCDKSFNDKSYLLRHVRTHTGEKPYSCSVCFKSFSQSSSVVAHMRIHTGERPFKCTECERRFSDKSYYLRHLRSHRGERPYKCKECDKCFTQTSSLACHMKLHTGAKPFRCSYCGEYFSNNSRLAAHKRLHQHEETQ